MYLNIFLVFGLILFITNGKAIIAFKQMKLSFLKRNDDFYEKFIDKLKEKANLTNRDLGLKQLAKRTENVDLDNGDDFFLLYGQNQAGRTGSNRDNFKKKRRRRRLYFKPKMGRKSKSNVEKDDEDDEEEENLPKLNQKQLEKIYRFIKKKMLYKKALDHPASNLPNRLIELLASRTAYDLALKWHSRMMLPISSLEQLELIFSRFYTLLYYILKSAQHKIWLFNQRSTNNHHHLDHDHNHRDIFDYFIEEANPKMWLYRKLTESNIFNDPRSRQHLFDVNTDLVQRNQAIPPLSSPLITKFSSLIQEKAILNSHKTDPLPNHSGLFQSIQHKLHVFDGTPSKDSFHGINSFLRPNHSPVVCTNYPEHSNEGFKGFISVESCTQPSFLSHTGIPVFGHGCTFKYICDFGYRPLDGYSASIRCLNGYWTSRAVCIKQETNLIQSTLEKQQHQITSNVFHPNYIKRSANRIKRSTDNDSEENTQEDDKVSNNDFKSLLQDDQLNGIDDLINKLSGERNNQSHIETSDSNKNDTENLLSNSLEAEEENSSLKSDFDQNEIDYSTSTITTLTKRLVTSTKATTIKTTSSDNKRKEEFQDQLDWLSLWDNDLEKSLDESFKELVDRN